MTTLMRFDTPHGETVFIRPDHVSAVVPSRGSQSEIHLQGGSRITVTGSANNVLGHLGIDVAGQEHPVARDQRPPSLFQGPVGLRGSEFGPLNTQRGGSTFPDATRHLRPTASA
ncbi:hypothetical protein ABIB25_000394 [Nakamurella sp. UYEF19]|uniref:hypothetical protein n=1 Tax=Nakamurella sp. UYEF19 TaxID=1756392 RepID=UPI00339314CE